MSKATKSRSRGLRVMKSRLYRESGIPIAVTETVMRGFTDFVATELQCGRSVIVNGLGKFYLIKRKGWTGIGASPRFVNGDWIPGHRVRRVHPAAFYPAFRSSLSLRSKVHQVLKPDYNNVTVEK